MPVKKTLFLLVFSLLKLQIVAASATAPDSSSQLIPDPTDTIVISQLIITGNKITKMPVITRELVLFEKDTIPFFVFEKAIERTKENLMNTGIFNFVNISYQLTSTKNTIVIVDVTEKWYIFPIPIFELVDRNFNEWAKSGDATRINYGFYLNWNNFRGMNESVKLLFRWGYSQQVGIFYSIPFINKNQDEGLTFNLDFSRNREVGYGINESKILRYQNSDFFVRKEIVGGVKYTRRDGFYNSSSFLAEYRFNAIADTILTLNPEFLGDGEARQELLVFTWQFRRDRRDYKIYPLKGYLFDFDIAKNGIGQMKNEPNLMYLISQIKYYHEFNKKWHFASALKGKVSGQSKAPYFNQRGFGFKNDFVRGYEFYVIPGQNFILSQNSLKFTLLSTRIISLPFSILEKFRTIPYAFYLNANFDAGFVRDRQYEDINPLANKWQYGYGLGIDYVTYYNMVLRIEYSLNKFGEKGFFLHFTAPI